MTILDLRMILFRYMLEQVDPSIVFLIEMTYLHSCLMSLQNKARNADIHTHVNDEAINKLGKNAK